MTTNVGSWDEEFQREKLKRVSELESKNHVFPKSLSKFDWALAFVVISVSGLLLIVGAWV